ncbi:MAG: glycosyltransferase family 4 protein [Anaerolineae bacterium]|nr:glycosyltransferase family 4 protein [Anaerolineae bacterium]
MRILLISGEYPPMQGGVGDYTRELGTALAQQGAEVHVLTTRQAVLGPEAIIVHPLISRWGWGMWRQAETLARQVQASIVHIQYQTAAYGMHPAINLLPRRLRRATTLRCLVTFHDLKEPYLFPKAGAVRRWVNRVLARACDAVVVTNQEDEAAIQKEGLATALHLIPIGSNIAPAPPPDYDRADWRRRHGAAPDDVALCYFGFLNASKGGETLIRALSLLAADRRYHLWMVGGQVGASDPTNRAYLSRVQALIGESGLEERVRWTGYTTAAEVSANLLAADIAVLPYRDGVSFRRGSLLAVLAHGLPIVTTQPALPLRELADGKTALLVPPDDPPALAAAVARLAADTALRERLGESARRVAAGFGWERIAARHLELYRKVISNTTETRRAQSE